jgi:5-methylthioadenosine/S-adenosylhomocysteine deaminase
MKTLAGYKLVRAKFLLPLAKPDQSERIEDGYILTHAEKIVEVGPYHPEIGARILNEHGDDLFIFGTDGDANWTGEAIPQLNAVLLPSFIKAHGHDHEQPLIGIAKDEPLTAWLDHAINPFTAFLNEKRDELTSKFGVSPNQVVYRLARINDIHYGITASLVHHCNHNKYRLEEIVLANREADTTLLVGVGSQDRFYDDRILDTPEQAVARLDQAESQFGGELRTTFLPGPDQFFSNSRSLLVPLKKWAREHGRLFHIHSSEEPKTTVLFKKQIEPGRTPIEFAQEIGILDGETIVAHQVNNGPNDIDILAKTGTCVVHNPLANTILGSGMPPVIEMLAARIPLAVSTDGSGSADNQNIIAAARLAGQFQKARLQDATVLPAQRLLELITIEPARMLRMNKGSLVPGKDADFVTISLDRPNLIPTRLDNVVENLIWAADGSEVRDVVGNGRVMKYAGKLLDFPNAPSILEMLDQGQELSELFIQYAQAMPEVTGTGAHQ